MAITRAQQAKQLLAQGGRIGFQGGGRDMSTVSAPGFSARDYSPAEKRDQQRTADLNQRIRESERGQQQTVNTQAAINRAQAQAEKAEAAAKEKRKTIRERLNDFNLKRRQDYINRILSQRQKKISSGLFDVEDMPGVDLMETEDYFGFAPSITDFGPEGTGKYSQQFIDDVLSGKRQPPEFFSKIDVGTTPGLATKGLATIANIFGKGMAGPVTKEELERLDKEKKAIMDIDPSKTTIEEMMETYEPNRFKLLNPEREGDGPQDPCKGPNPPAYCFIGSKADDTQEDVITRNLAGLTPRIGGSMFDFTGMAEGGLADMDREAFLLGGIAKGLKKAVKGVKKLAKSPIGKAAIGAALFGGFGKGTLFGKGSFFGTGLNPLKDATKIGKMSSGLGKFLSKYGLTDFVTGDLTGLGKGVFGLGIPMALSAFTSKPEDNKFDLASYYAQNQLEPSQSIRGMGSEFDFYGGERMRVADGGDVEPVAKKTMPLLDMDGKEKDYRETGGFVDMGRMERADDVPARLSKNEFVFTADAVRNAGEGDIDKGAEVMYNMMKNLEAGGEVSEESQGLEGAREMFQTSQRLGEVI